IFVAGGEIDLSSFLPKGAFPTDLPTYPFDRQTHVLELTAEAREGIYSRWDHPLLGERGQSALGEWTINLGAKNPAFLADHKVAGSILFPAAGFVEMALAASRTLHGDNGQVIENLEIHAPLILEEKNLKTIRFEIKAEDGSFTIRSRPYLSEGQGMINVTGRIAGSVITEASEPWNIDTALAKGPTFKQDDFYSCAKTLGLDYGPAFQGLKQARTHGDFLYAELALPEMNLAAASDYVLHPSLSDSCLQALFVLLKDRKDLPKNTVFLPSVFGKITVHIPGATEIICHAKLTRISARSIIADFRLEDEAGNLVAELEECRFRKFESASASKIPSRYKQVLVPVDLQKDTVSLLSLTELAEKGSSKQSKNISKYATFRDEVLPLTEALTSAFAFEAITSLGGDFKTGVTADALLASALVVPEQKHFLEYLLYILEEDDLVIQTDKGWLRKNDAEIYNPADIWRLLIQDHPETLPEMTLLGRSGLMLKDILQGKISSVDFSYNSGTAIPKFATAGSKLTDTIDEQTNEAVIQIAQNYSDNARLRILEIDGHNVLGTKALLDEITGDQTNFLFTSTNTDVHHRAQQDLSPMNGVACQLLEDISAETVTKLQSEFGSFDIIISRGTPWSPPHFEAISYLSRHLLTQGGILIVSQTSEGRLANLIAGGTEGWWNRSTIGQKPTPLSLPASAWSKHLEAGQSFAAEILLDATDTCFENGFVLAAEHLKSPVSLIEEDVEDLDHKQTSITLFLTDSAEDKDYAKELSNSLQDRTALFVSVENKAGRLSDNQFGLSSFSASAFQELGRDLSEQGVIVESIVHLAGFFVEQEEDALNAQQARCASLICALQGFEETVLLAKPSLIIVTKGSQAFDGITPSPLQSPLWGLGRVITNEYPDLKCKLIDQKLPDARSLAKEILRHDRENEVILSGSQRFGTRLRPEIKQAVFENFVANVGLNFKAPGALENLAWFEKEIPEPTEDEICIEMKATGLNFRDVMWAMGILKDEAVENGYAGPTLGMEGAGIITKTGANVDGFEPGDRVMNFASNCFSKFLCTKTTAVAKIPDGMSFEEAATIPSVFFTVYYAFEHLARLQPGERVLIHGAAGGVGLAAIQYARHVGAEIFVTAGSDEKGDFLKLQGIDHILDS
ncbi:MAG: polyketide synthase dehydratase domain-containing protein, partial [Sneathiella sp.]|nr:polyketide synthase dehydratase domain-containing protein [Sneathiella sp.]